MKKYDVITANDLPSLVKKVNEAVNYRPIGGHSVTNDKGKQVYSQSVELVSRGNIDGSAFETKVVTNFASQCGPEIKIIP